LRWQFFADAADHMIVCQCLFAGPRCWQMRRWIVAIMT